MCAKLYVFEGEVGAGRCVFFFACKPSFHNQDGSKIVLA